MLKERHGRPRGEGHPTIGIVVGQHPLEEAAYDVGVNLHRALARDGVDVRLFEVPRELTYLEVLPPLFAAFERGELSEKGLKANIMYHNSGRESLLYLMRLASEHPNTRFYSIHNFVARYDGRREVPEVGWGEQDIYGWTPLDKLKVRTYPDEEHVNAHLPNILQKLFTGGVSMEDFDTTKCHITVALGGGTYRFQTEPREALTVRPASDIPSHTVRVSTVEVPGLVTHFLGEEPPTEEKPGLRYIMSPQLFGSLDEFRRGFGITRGIEDRILHEMLLELYLFKWTVFDKELNKRASLTGDFVVSPLRDFIIEDVKNSRKQVQ